MNAMQRALLPAAFGTLFCSTAFGQVDAGTVVNAGHDKVGALAETPRSKLLVDYSVNGGILGISRGLTIDVDGNANYLERGGKAPKTGSARLEHEEVVGLTRALAEYFRVPPHLGAPILPGEPDRKVMIEDEKGQLLTCRANGRDPRTAALVDWLDEVAALAKTCVLADEHKLFEAKLARPDRGGLSASGVIVTRDETAAIRFEIDARGRRTMSLARRLSATEAQTVLEMIAVADPQHAAAATPPARPDRFVMRFWDPYDATARRDVGALAGIAPILPGDGIVAYLMAP